MRLVALGFLFAAVGMTARGLYEISAGKRETITEVIVQSIVSVFV